VAEPRSAPALRRDARLVAVRTMSLRHLRHDWRRSAAHQTPRRPSGHGRCTSGDSIARLGRTRSRGEVVSHPASRRRPECSMLAQSPIEVETPVRMPRRSPWVRGPGWDGFWMLSALWLAPAVVWLSRGYADREERALDLLSFGLTALFWIGHRRTRVGRAACVRTRRLDRWFALARATWTRTDARRIVASSSASSGSRRSVATPGHAVVLRRFAVRPFSHFAGASPRRGRATRRPTSRSRRRRS
jgi:hypothetical protein